MKKVLVAVAMIFGLGTSVVCAQEVKDSTTVAGQVAPQQTVTEDGFVKIKAAELPQVVMNQLAVDYKGASIKATYVTEKEGTKIYKILVVTKENQEVTAILNEMGEKVEG